MQLRSRNIVPSHQGRCARKRSHDVLSPRLPHQSANKRPQLSPPKLKSKTPGDGCRNDVIVSALTQSNLAKHTNQMARGPAAFARRGHAEDIEIGFADPPRPKSTTTTTTTDPKFGQALYRNRIIVDRSDAPDDLEQIKAMLCNRRDSVSAIQEDFEDYQYQAAFKGNEATGKSRAWFHVAKQPRPPFSFDENCLWTGYGKESPQTNQFTSLQKPDYSQSLPIEMYPFHALEYLGGYLQPADSSDLAIPHFAAEFKRLELTADSARYQCAYDGAAMLEAHRVVMDFLGQPFQYGQTLAFTVAFTPTNMNIYAHHMKQKEGQDTYFAHCVGAFRLNDSFEEFQNARLALRNAQTFAETEDQRILEALVAMDARRRQ